MSVLEITPAIGVGDIPANLPGASRVIRDAAATRDTPTETEALIDHIVARYHDTHRRELAGLIPLAREVERVHGGDAGAPLGLADLLAAMRAELEEHMDIEERVLFPLMRWGGGPMIAQPIAQLRHEHDAHGDRLKALEHLAHGFRPPVDVRGSWRALYAGARKFAEDLVAHIYLENEILYPRFEGDPAR